ncbi:hypothetical protein [Granulicella sp. L46]|uniref:hypothetical protein n=1 Tax=Granulicella sp. L46 TaxID=1641865 RepID=UPI00131E9363|nr:hypothetical protein [Granulicella sp. L46]
MISSEKLDDLRALISDESITLAGRMVAAEHAVRLQVAAVPEPTEDHAEVQELLKPWPRETALERQFAEMFEGATGGRSLNGWSLKDALVKVKERLVFRAFLAIVVDESIHRLERLEACRVILEDHLHPQNTFRFNRLSPEMMLERVLPDTTMKSSGYLSEPKVPVERPPQSLEDVWRM